MAAASVSSLGPPNIGPGNSAANIGFTVSSKKSLSATRLNSEPLSGNTLCHKNNVERKRAIHENRLASVKASLSLSTPRRMDFMDKRLSKNFHQRRHHEKLVYDNLKLLRALEEIHSRSSTAVPAGDGITHAGGGSPVWATRGCHGEDGSGAGASSAVDAKKSKGLVSGSATIGGGPSRKTLNSLLARKRRVKAALVARENQKMIERMAKSKSLYSRDKMRQHRARHQRVLRLRKTDYTAGHLLAAATAKRHWSGGDSRDEGFSYSFEEGRHRHRHRSLHTERNRDRVLGSERANATSVSNPTNNLRGTHSSSAAGRGASYSPTRGGLSSRSIHKGGGGNEICGRGTKSAPRLPSLYDVDDIYGGGGMLGSPSLEECREAIEMPSRSGESGGSGGGGGSGSRTSSSRNSAPGSGNNEGDSLPPRPSTEGGNGSRRGSRHHRRSSRRRRGKDAIQSGTGAGGSSTGGVRGTDGSVDSLSHRLGSFAGPGGDAYGGTRGGGRSKGQRGRGGAGSRGDKSSGSAAGVDKLGEGDDLDKIFNPLAFLDEMKGVRVLIQATKPLEVLNHAGETWICFIRIMVKDPFDDQLDIRVIHDREEVCRRVLSLEEANAICRHAQLTSGGAAVRDRFSVFTPTPCSSPSPLPSSSGITAPPAPSSSETATLPFPSATTVSSTAGAAAITGGAVPGGEDATGSTEVEPRSTQVSGAGLERHSKDDGGLNEFLTTLFKQADTEQKGFLTPEQLTSIMQHAELGLTGPELHLVIAEADDNADGTIDYFEFIPLAYNLVNAFRARRRACEEMDEANFELDQKAIHALYDAEFDRLVRQLKSLCKSCDPDGTGVLPRAEFKQCVSGDRCGGLTNIESKLLLNLLPKDSHGNVIYRKLGAGLEQVRFTTLRNTVAEASATDTQKYLMALCREEDAKSDHLGNKGHIKSNGDAMAIGGKHYSGVLRARQLTKLLLNAPLLSLSRLHVTALMSQAHIVDGMVNYVELVPIISKTIEGMFHPQSLKMRHEIFKNRGTGRISGGSGTGGGGAADVAEASSQHQGASAVTVLGKSRDDIQRIFVDVLREDKKGVDIERLKDPATFERCIASLGLDLEPDTISALWVAADLDSRPGTTFVDVVDFCFNCVLFMEREKEVKTLQRTRNTTTKASQNGLSGRTTPGAAAAARAEAVAAAALAGRKAPLGKADPLLSLARTLVRHAKVIAPSEGKVGLEFQLGRQGCDPEEDGNTTSANGVSPEKDGQLRGRRQSHADGGRLPRAVNGDKVVSSLSTDTDEEDENNASGEGGAIREWKEAGRGGGGVAAAEAAAATAGLQLRSEAPESMVLLRARRRIPVVGSSGQPIMILSSSSPTPPTTSTTAVVTATRTSDGKASRQRNSTSSLEAAEAARGETRDMFVRVFWDGAARDRAYVEAYPTRAGRGESGGEGGQSPLLSLGVRVPTLAVVDAHAALKFAERVVAQIAVQVDDEKLARGEKKLSDRQKCRHHGGRLRLSGVDAKSVVVGNQ